jgi:hypothetical protein
MNGWFDRHWAGRVPGQELFRGPYFAVVACWLGRHAALVVMNPVGGSDAYPGFFSMRVSAWLPDYERLGEHPSTLAARRALASVGFTLELTRAGLVGMAESGPAKAALAAASPEPLAEALLQLWRTARELGAEPVDIA